MVEEAFKYLGLKPWELAELTYGEYRALIRGFKCNRNREVQDILMGSWFNALYYAQVKTDKLKPLSEVLNIDLFKEEKEGTEDTLLGKLEALAKTFPGIVISDVE